MQLPARGYFLPEFGLRFIAGTQLFPSYESQLLKVDARCRGQMGKLTYAIKLRCAILLI